MPREILQPAYTRLLNQLRGDFFGAWKEFGDACIVDDDAFETLRQAPSIVVSKDIVFRAGRVLPYNKAFPAENRVPVPDSVDEPAINFSLGGEPGALSDRPDYTAFHHATDLEMQVRVYQGNDLGWQFFANDGDLVVENAHWLHIVAAFSSMDALNIVYLDKSATRGIFAHSKTSLSIKTPIIPVVGRGNYHHFMIDQLPILMLARATGVTNKAAAALAPLSAMQREVCATYGVDTSAFLELEALAGGQRFTSFHLADAYLPAFIPLPLRLEILREANGANRLPRGTEKIFLGRKPSPGISPRLTNQNEIEAVLARNGFRVVYAEDYPPARQKELFAKACIVVGAHGAGLTNMVFAPKDLLLVEIMNDASNADDNGHFDVYKRMCNCIGQNYQRIVCPTLAGSSGLREQDRPMTCDPQRLERLVACAADALGL
jgi:hypothetical protein